MRLAIKIAGFALALGWGFVVGVERPASGETPEAGNQQPGSLAGAIRDDRGAPIAGARVCASRFPVEWSHQPTCTVAGRDGGFMIASLPAAAYQVAAMAPRFAFEVYGASDATPAPSLALKPGEQRGGIALVLHAGVEVSGVIHAAGGGPLAHAVVRIDADVAAPRNTSITVATDDHGRYTAWTRATAIAVTAGADGYVPDKRTGDAPAQLDVALLPAATLAGTVVDATGAPAAGVEVDPISTELLQPSPDDTATTDAAGRFALHQLPPGRYQVRARASHGVGLTEATTALGLGQHADGVVVRLTAAHEVVGQVIVDATGAPCAHAWVLLSDEAHRRSAYAAPAPDGTLRAGGVLPGRYVAHVSCDGYVARASYPLVVVGDRDVTARWEVGAGGAIAGRVATAAGQPVAGIRVTADRVLDAPRASVVTASTWTTAGGSYALRGLAPGRYRIAVQRPRPQSQSVAEAPIVAEVAITGHETVARELVVPASGGTVVGRVATPQGASPGRVRVDLVDARDSVVTITQADDGGRFELQDVPPGSYRARAWPWASHGDVRNVPQAGAEVTVRTDRVADARLVVELPAGMIRGRVIDDHGRPVTDAFVGLAVERDAVARIGSARGDDDAVRVGRDGRFVATQLADGRYTVRASRRSGGEVIATHVALGSELTLTLAATGSIAGTVHRRAGCPLDIALIDRNTDERMREETLAATDGRFELRDVTPGHYQVVVSTCDGDQRVELDVAAGQRASLDVTLAGLVTLVGRAIDLHTRQPVAGAMLVAQVVGADRSVAFSDDLHNVTEADGRFEIPRVPRGAIRIYGTARGELAGELSPVSTERTVPLRGPDVVDLGTIAVVTIARTAQPGQAGLSLEPGDPAVAARITAVEPGGAAARAGLIVGDVVTAIGGFDTTGANAAYASDLLRGEAGATVAITVARGVTRTLVLAR